MRKVMIVEDEELILQGIKNIVHWNELELQLVHMAHSGQEALEMWKKEPVDIILTDIEMPEMSGLELLKKIRSEEELVRFIILTGYDDFEYAREAIHLEVENYILKPINEEELEKQLKEAAAKLEELEKKKIRYIDEKTEWLQFLSGKISETGYEYYCERLQLYMGSGHFWAAVMKWSTDSVKENKITDMILSLQNTEKQLRVVHLPPDCLLLLLDGFGESQEVKEYFQRIQNEIESQFDIVTYISIGPVFDNYRKLPECYRVAMKLQKYLLVDGLAAV